MLKEFRETRKARDIREWITSSTTIKESIAMSTRHINVTITVQPAQRWRHASAMGREQQIVLTTGT
jgi:hypothetical protein